MLPICYACLQTDKELQLLGVSLSEFHDELCDYAVDSSSQFCTDCSYLLQIFQDFKTKCVQAIEILNKWRKSNSKVRVPLNSLIKQLPESSLDFCIKTNVAEVCYEGGTLLKTELTHIDDSEHSIDNTSNCQPTKHTLTNNTAFVDNAHIDNMTIINMENENTDYEMDDSPNIVEETKMEYEFINENAESLESFENLPVKDDIDSNSDNESNESEIYELLKDVNKSDSSDDEDIKQILSKNDVKIGVKDKKPRNKSSKGTKQKAKHYDVYQLRDCLKVLFANSGEVKDDEGNVIEKDCILENLDKLHIYTLNQIGNRCVGTSTLTSHAIKVLSRVQKTYGNQYSSVFDVEHLPTEELVLEEFQKRKHYESYVTAEYKCTLCYKGFKHKKQFEYHQKMRHDPSLPVCCSVCQMRLKNRAALIKHTNLHKIVYKCKLCPLVTSYSDAMKNHYQQHKGVTYTCELCKNTFKSRSSQRTHMNQVHQTQHICTLCARTFVSNVGLAQHRTRKHNINNEELIETADSVKCETCNITFVSSEVYTKHLVKSHGETIATEYVYKKRNVRSSGRPRKTPNLVCRVCGAVLSGIGALSSHLNREHPTTRNDLPYSDYHKFLCHVCGKRFISMTYLNEHKHVHTGAKPYACDQCPKAFHRRLNLKNHLERHLPPSRECHHCGKKFVSTSNLNNHIRSHIRDRRYKCTICDKGFIHSAALTEHVKGVHYHIRRVKKPLDSKKTVKLTN